MNSTANISNPSMIQTVIYVTTDFIMNITVIVKKWQTGLDNSDTLAQGKNYINRLINNPNINKNKNNDISTF